MAYKWLICPPGADMDLCAIVVEGPCEGPFGVRRRRQPWVWNLRQNGGRHPRLLDRRTVIRVFQREPYGTDQKDRD